jgi:preprotein translocase SecE subunit
VARDRRRAKQRRERQARSGNPTAQDADAGLLPHENPQHEHEPAELASGDVDLVEAQLAVGRPELADPDATNDEPLGGSTTGELFEAAREDPGVEPDDGGAGDGGRNGGGDTALDSLGGRSPEPKQRHEGTRFGNFLRGSWRELQRVQWPDRRAVAQATAVVVGFVLISGAFLGLADWLSSRIVDLIV